MIGKQRGRGRKPPQPLSEEEIALFRQAVADVRPLHHDRALLEAARPWPAPRQTWLDEQQVLADSLSDHISWADRMETGEELVFLRNGLASDVLKKLRRGHWVIQSEVDLHGHNSDGARQLLIQFLNECRRFGHRCVRVIHGKGLGSKNREPVLKLKAANWLMQRDEVLAFCQARAADGGGGALVVLLKAVGRVV